MRAFSRSALAASEETLERRAAGLAGGDGAAGSRASDSGSGIPEPSLGPRRTPPDEAQAPLIDQRSGQWVSVPFAEPDSAPAPASGAHTPARGSRGRSQASDVSWESGLQVSGDPELEPAAGNAGDSDRSDLFRTAPEPEDVEPVGVDEAHHASTGNDDGASGTLTTRPDATRGDDANPTGAVAEPGDSTISGAGDGAGPRSADTAPPTAPGIPGPEPTGAAGNPPGTDATLAGTSATDVDAGATGTRSNLFGEPAPFEGRSLGGTSRADDSKELARALDGAELPVEDLAAFDPDPAELARKSSLENPDGGPVPDSYRDADDMPTRTLREWAEHDRNRRRNQGGNTAQRKWEWRPRPPGGDSGSQRPLVRIRCGRAHLVDHLRRRFAPAHGPRRVRLHTCFRDEGGHTSTGSAAPTRRTPSTAPIPPATSPGPGAGGRHASPVSAASRMRGTSSRSHPASAS